MKILIRIMAAPIVACLAVLVWISSLILKISAGVLGIASSLISVLGVLLLVIGDTSNGLAVLLIAFAVSPIGLPMIGVWLIGQVQSFRYLIQNRVYG